MEPLPAPVAPAIRTWVCHRENRHSDAVLVSPDGNRREVQLLGGLNRERSDR